MIGPILTEGSLLTVPSVIRFERLRACWRVWNRKLFFGLACPLARPYSRHYVLCMGRAGKGGLEGHGDMMIFLGFHKQSS